MACWMEREEPPPISIMAMTAAMPMMMPRQVSAERMTLRRSACNAMRAVRAAFLNWLKLPCSWRAGRWRQARGFGAVRELRLRRRAFLHNHAVLHANDSLRVTRDVFIVRDDDDGQAFLPGSAAAAFAALPRSCASRDCRSARRRAAIAGG